MHQVEALQQLVYGFRQAQGFRRQHAAQADLVGAAAAAEQREVDRSLLGHRQGRVDATQVLAEARAVFLHRLENEVVLGREVIVDAGSFHPHQLGQVAIAEAVEAAAPDQDQGVLEQLLAYGLRFHKSSVSTRR
ncbi:hypothetical protein D3C72_1880360 [compost metagenome]